MTRDALGAPESSRGTRCGASSPARPRALLEFSEGDQPSECFHSAALLLCPLRTPPRAPRQAERARDVRRSRLWPSLDARDRARRGARRHARLAVAVRDHRARHRGVVRVRSARRHARQQKARARFLVARASTRDDGVRAIARHARPVAFAPRRDRARRALFPAERVGRPRFDRACVRDRAVHAPAAPRRRRRACAAARAGRAFGRRRVPDDSGRAGRPSSRVHHPVDAHAGGARGPGVFLLRGKSVR